MPLLIILAYRLIPRRVRRLWSCGSSSSHLALADPTWASIHRYALAPAWRMIHERNGPYFWGETSVQQRGGGSWSDPRDL